MDNSDKQLTRRNALEKLGTAIGIAGISLILPNTYAQQFQQSQPQTQMQVAPQNVNLTNPHKNVYRLVSRRTMRKFGIDILDAELYIESDVWDNLPKRLSLYQFYNQIKNAQMMNVSITKYEGGHRRHPEPLDSIDFEKQFLEEADVFASERAPAFDPYAAFNTGDVNALSTMLTRELYRVEPDKQTQRPVKKRFIFPPNSKVHIQFGKSNSIDMFVNISKRPTREVVPFRVGPALIRNPAEIQAMSKFFRQTMLAEDKETPGYDGRYIRCPLENIYYNAYQRRP